MKSQTQRFRAMFYRNFKVGTIHSRNEVYEKAQPLDTTQEWLDRWLRDLVNTKEIEWLGNGRFKVLGLPNRLDV